MRQSLSPIGARQSDLFAYSGEGDQSERSAFRMSLPYVPLHGTDRYGPAYPGRPPWLRRTAAATKLGDQWSSRNIA